MKSRVLKTTSRALLLGFLLFVLLLFACFPSRYMSACLDGITLWATCVLPSTLPFLFVTGLLTRGGYVTSLSKIFSPATSRLFALNGVSGYCLLLSFLSGYPVGAKTLADLREQGAVSPSEATKMSFLCSSSGPLFILGSVGMGMFSDGKIGLILLLSHFSAILASGVVFRFYPAAPSGQALQKIKRADNLLYECMYASVLSVLCVGGFIAVFYTLSVILTDWHLLAPLSLLLACGMDGQTAAAFCRGLVEMTGGCRLLSQDACALHVALCAFLITFGGVSVLLQQIVYLKKAGVKLPVFLPAKLMQSLLAAGIAAALASVFL